MAISPICSRCGYPTRTSAGACWSTIQRGSMGSCESMQAKPVNELTASEIVAAVAAGETTREAGMRACLDRIAAREPQVQAWTTLDPERALAAARAVDREGRGGPRAGGPVRGK